MYLLMKRKNWRGKLVNVQARDIEAIEVYGSVPGLLFEPFVDPTVGYYDPWRMADGGPAILVIQEPNELAMRMFCKKPKRKGAVRVGWVDCQRMGPSEVIEVRTGKSIIREKELLTNPRELTAGVALSTEGNPRIPGE